MILYHGSNIVVEKPMILIPNPYLDFGAGFYITSNLTQAKSFTEKAVACKDEEKHIVSKYDLIYGPVANDDIFRTFILYSTGVLSKEQTLEALKIKELYNQYVFATEEALKALKFIGVEE